MRSALEAACVACSAILVVCFTYLLWKLVLIVCQLFNELLRVCVIASLLASSGIV